MVTTIRTLIIVIILLITNFPTFAQSIQGKWYTAESWADNSTIYCKRDSSTEFSKVIKIDSSVSFSYNSVDENIEGVWKRRDNLYFNFIGSDSNFNFTYFFTYQMLIITGKHAYIPIEPKPGEKTIYDPGDRQPEFPGGENKFRIWCEGNLDLNKRYIVNQLKEMKSIEFDFLINTEGKIDSIIFYGSFDKKLSEKISDLFSEIPLISPAQYVGPCMGKMTVMLRLNRDKKRYYFEQITEERY